MADEVPKEQIFFNKFVTKGLTTNTDSGRRLFEGYLTVQVVDKQNEVTVVDELIKVLPIWMTRGAPITDTHSNRVVGRGINFAKTVYKDTDGSEYPAIQIMGEIHKDYELDHLIWNAIKDGKYKGLSFGGATRSNRTPVIQKDGRIAYELKDLEHYEVAVCPEPAVHLALITRHNEIAKAVGANYSEYDKDNICIKCDKYGCVISKQVDEIISREHELLGEKPDKKEEQVHEELREEFKKSDVEPKELDDHVHEKEEEKEKEKSGVDYDILNLKIISAKLKYL